MLKPMFKRLRQRRLSIRIALLAIFGLLFSQAVLAAHFDCAFEMATVDQHTAMPCHGEAKPTDVPLDEVICQSHCSAPDLKHDSMPAYSVPALPCAPHALEWRAPDNGIDFLSSGLEEAGSLPAWHRPTAHPASLLLI